MAPKQAKVVENILNNMEWKVKRDWSLTLVMAARIRKMIGKALARQVLSARVTRMVKVAGMVKRRNSQNCQTLTEAPLTDQQINVPRNRKRVVNTLEPAELQTSFCI